MARGHHVYCLFRIGINKFNSQTHAQAQGNPDGVAKAGRFFIALGGVTCTFKRELKPYQRYEIWTRVLSWDEKWLYLVSHIIEPGKVKPTVYSDQPWRNNIRKKSLVEPSETPDIKTLGKGEATSPTPTSKPDSSTSLPSSVNPTIYATSLSKYAFKQGRLTIPPATFLAACHLLPAPPVPEDTAKPSYHTKDRPSDQAENEVWKAIESKRKGGWETAMHMAGLDVAFGLFSRVDEKAFARY